MGGFTHFDDKGAAHMVDVGDKDITERQATAAARITMLPETLILIRDGKAKKGDVLSVARLAGIMAAKKTPDLIPLCHPLALTNVSVDFELDEDGAEERIAQAVKEPGMLSVHTEEATLEDIFVQLAGQELS